MSVLIKFVFFFYLIHVGKSEINLCMPNEVAQNISDSLQNILDIFKFDIDEFNFTKINVNLKHEAFEFKGTLENVSVSNLQDYYMCLVDMDLQNNKFDLFNLTLNNLKVNGHYDITGNIGQLFDIFGIGDFEIKMKNFSMAATHFNFSASQEVCMTINLEMNIVEVDSYFQNLMNDEELEEMLNAAIASILPDSMKIMWQEFKDKYDKDIEKWLNDFFHGQFPSAMFYLANLRDQKAQFPMCFSNENN